MIGITFPVSVAAGVWVGEGVELSVTGGVKVGGGSAENCFPINCQPNRIAKKIATAPIAATIGLAFNFDEKVPVFAIGRGTVVESMLNASSKTGNPSRYLPS